MQKNWQDSDLGVIKIQKNVIASIAALAAEEIQGVKRICGNLKSTILSRLGNKIYASIKVSFDKNEEVTVEVPLIIKYGFDIPEIAAKAQENIRISLEKMTHLTIKEVVINVQGIEK